MAAAPLSQAAWVPAQQSSSRRQQASAVARLALERVF
jgi:hypothetical protein